ncbi:hypothetical protein [Janthinobacterium sp.]|uniref:hypothetical protein n=1 Tax=Janthinobacterium sp. TaxID=1871054 RepID=UPI0025C484C1|nr:hypothetical protein [Janthinobacterium sp.]
MITVLTQDSYRGFSAPLTTAGGSVNVGVQPIFIGRVLWPGSSSPEDAVIKLYRSDTCGPANEVIGYAANAERAVNQPKKSAILLLSKRELPDLGIDLDDFLDSHTGLTACWATSLEQGTQPFKFVRRLSSFSSKKLTAFFKSRFCRILAAVDHVTGNNDRHDGNYLYLDDLQYLAIDQGCVGGGLRWHTTWPDRHARNELFHFAQSELSALDFAAWKAEAIMEHERSQHAWSLFLGKLRVALTGILESGEIDMIVEYMQERADGPKFAVSCGKLI